MPELVQALRSIGENNITQEDETRIGQLFAETPETETIEHDLLLAPVWMRQIIKNVFVKPNKQSGACFDSAMARKGGMKSKGIKQ